tara:strand:- start:1681 stop:2229 length:549 start_codon:yes stop_codon:yes gene_type:complete
MKTKNDLKIWNKKGDNTWRLENDKSYYSNWEYTADRAIYGSEDKHCIGYRNKKGEIYVYRTEYQHNDGKSLTRLGINGQKLFEVNLSNVFEKDGILLKKFKSIVDKNNEGIDVLLLKYELPDSSFYVSCYSGYGRMIPYNDIVEVVSVIGSLDKVVKRDVVYVDFKTDEKLKKTNRIEGLVI